MKKKKILLGLLLGLGILFTTPQKSFAASCDNGKYGISNVKISPDSFQAGEVDKITVSFDVDTYSMENDDYRLSVFRNVLAHITERSNWQTKKDGTRNLSFNITKDESLGVGGKFDLESVNGVDTVTVSLDKATSSTGVDWCRLGTYAITKRNYSSSCQVTISQERDSKTCYYDGNSDCFEVGETMRIEASGLMSNNKPYVGSVRVVVGQDPGGQRDNVAIASNGKIVERINLDREATYTINLKPDFSPINQNFCSLGSFQAVKNCPATDCNTTKTTLTFKDRDIENQVNFNLCAQVPTAARGDCDTCYDNDGIWTSIGCIETTTEGIVGKLMRVGMSIAGGIALLMILASAFLFATSEGEPKRTSEAKEILTNAIVGLIFIIFSITILEFIGVKIFMIPEFGV